MAALKHSAYLNDEWTPEEQSILEELLTKYSSKNAMYYYAQIAMQLKDKCLRDVIFRCKWMSKNGKHGGDHFSRKNKNKKVKLADLMPKLTRTVDPTNGPPNGQATMPQLTHIVNPTNGSPNAQAIMPMDSDGGISYQAIGGSIGQLLEQNAQILDQISANFDANKVEENINNLLQAQNNILNLINDMNDMPQMKLAPPLPVRLKQELLNIILQSPPSVQDKS